MDSKYENLSLPEFWNIENGLLVRRIKLESYSSGVEIVFKVARIASDQNHHPDITLKYGEVEITSISHDVNAITERDIKLAEQINETLSSH